MIDALTLTAARNEITRLNRELAELHLEEERCKLKRGRLESEKARVQSLVDIAELIQRLADKAVDHTPAFHVETANGAKFVVVDKPDPAPIAEVPKRQRLKPDGLPTVAVMIITALQQAGKAERPAEIADYVRHRWWPDLPTTTINVLAWRMAKAGRLTHQDGRYGLNGIGH
jgi:hypothetical protein